MNLVQITDHKGKRRVGLVAADLDGDGYGDLLAGCQNQQLSTWWGSASGLAAALTERTAACS